MSTIPQEDWIWQGHPGHFICARDCFFRLNTVVGKYLISTVGEYRIGNSLEPIGSGRKYETMVFKAMRCPCDDPECHDIVPEPSMTNIDFDAYNARQAALEGHIEMCNKYAQMGD